MLYDNHEIARVFPEGCKIHSYAVTFDVSYGGYHIVVFQSFRRKRKKESGVIGWRQVARWIAQTLFALAFLQASGTLCSAEDELYVFCKDHKYGYINVHGEVVVQPTFDSAGDFHDGRAVVKVGDKYGYIDANGRVAISLNYAYASDFSGGRATAIVRESKWPFGSRDRLELIETSGTALKVLSPEISEVKNFSLGLAAADGYEGWGFIDVMGNWAIPPQFAEVQPFMPDGLALVSRTPRHRGINIMAIDDYEFIDTHGKTAISLKANLVESFSDGLGRTSGPLSGHWTYIDKTGKEVLRLGSGSLDFHSGLAATPGDGWWALVDKSGTYKLAVDGAQELGSLYDKLIRFKSDGHYGFLATDGNTVIPAVLYSADEQKRSLVLGTFGTTEIFFNTAGQVVWSSAPLPPGWMGCKVDIPIAGAVPADLWLKSPTEIMSSITPILEQLSGLKLKTRPEVRLLDGSEYSKFVESVISTREQGAVYESLLYRKLGMLTPQRDFGAELAQFYADTNPAFYAREINTIAVNKEVVPFWMMLGLVHASVRAIAEQNVQNPNQGAHEGEGREALIEGIAKKVTAGYASRIELEGQSSAAVPAHPIPAKDVSEFVKEFALRSGLLGDWFLSRGRSSQYFSACPQDISKAAFSLPQIKEPLLYHETEFWGSQGTSPLVAAGDMKVGNGWSIAYQDALGAIKVNSLLAVLAKSRPQMPEEGSPEDIQAQTRSYFTNQQPLLNQLVGDRLLAMRRNGEEFVYWSTRWKDRQSAEQFKALLKSYAPNLGILGDSGEATLQLSSQRSDFVEHAIVQLLRSEEE
jgi:hypothetical protein